MGFSFAGIWSTIYIIFIAAIILFLAYIVTRFIGSKYMNTLKGKNITVIETVSLGIDKVIYLVKIGNQYFMISSSGKNINFLCEINSSNVINGSVEIGNPASFGGNSFTKYLERFMNKQGSISKDSNNNEKSSILDSNQKIDENVGKIRDIFNNIKVSNEDGVE